MENSSNVEQVKDIFPILRLAVTLIFSMTNATLELSLSIHKGEVPISSTHPELMEPFGVETPSTIVSFH